ncbi:DUF4252 domain-containing protein [Capnocytophaga canimorsus]|uniref:DUF4252 domain-containing protein n=1 Tax=Capnocytophaga canimorsus (strain 5) TaxID=860228 RepID=F9YSM1_CAPCC|nr:DUF4252 domain-containing protein [Capnocytophaga canimorsus]AEK22694.1 Conserved hypothetical protein [Capnocytophaga canimorsus Cc5]AWL79326.1 DUF4252 domain-containing protein [Capnocytophaga canimorsus]AYW35902.1 DUF4252 domain-containing protein [Capnocytophaga canimorsus]
MNRLKFVRLMSLFLLLFMGISCQNQSLQRYMVEKSERPNFTNLTMNPNDFLGAIATQQEKVSFLTRVDKINVLSYERQDEITFEKELSEAKQMIKNQNLNELVRFNEKNISTQVLYMGTDENIREVILFFVQKGERFAITRIITQGVHIDEISQLVSLLQLQK